ncbi:hypothetical protein GCM10011380_04840 [Sphingomonas metalli]|uniref:C-type lysozyme inhibitor domain-containing protein n=1 Tax=Sphingomonas metalli TaxID=1779358 RepID=A0A916SX49_9SPHN|nr:hypothetical protein [Sphingomonas metalli]GGB18320.1 hypothetical protein GCM10011380_04840 [Sphingomonas metalli]
MTKLSLLILTPLLALGACNSQPSQPEVVVTNPDPLQNKLATAPKAELPPAIRADKSLRCGDGSLVAITFFQGDKQIMLRAPAKADPIKLVAPEAGKPYVGENGTTVSGDEKSVKVTLPGKSALTCHD